MIKFLQHSSTQYPPRTYENASADATIAFAFNFHTPGETLTKDSVKTQGKLYIPIRPTFSTRDIELAASFLKEVNAKTLNIAGNGAYTNIKYQCTQAQCDQIVFTFLSAVLNLYEPDYGISLIRSGGQSGFDEAGLKAAVRLGIPALCLCPRGWKFADVNGKTFCDEQQFKNRFAGVLSL